MEDKVYKERANKPALSLIPPNAICAVTYPLEHGVYKYGVHNYLENGDEVDYSDYVEAANRHILKWFAGEDLDKDNNCHHLDCAVANLLMARELMLRGKGKDTRYKEK